MKSAHRSDPVRERKAPSPVFRQRFLPSPAPSNCGFDWNNPLAVLAKIREEADEIEAEIAAGNKAAAAGELGDLLFAVVNLARHLDVDPEAMLRATNRKFERRFAAIERALGELGKTPEEATIEEMENLWNEAKAAERL